MKYETYPFLNKKISRFILGGSSWYIKKGKDLNSYYDSMYELGINTFDTARGYKNSEAMLGKWLKTKNREDIVIISKCCLPSLGFIDRLSVKNIRKDVEKSVSILGTYIDILYLHRDNLKRPVGPIMEELNKLIKEGKVKALGVSNWRVDRIDEANKYAKEHGLVGFSVTSPAYSLADMVFDSWKGGAGCVSLQGEKMESERAYLLEHKIPVFPFSSLGRGFFAGRFKHDDPQFKKNLDPNARKQYYYDINIKRLERAEELAQKKNCTVAQINFAYLLHQKFNVHPVVAASTAKRMKENIDSLNVQLSDEELKYLQGF